MSSLLLAEGEKESPIIINGDNVEYSADNKEVTATGNIEVIYKGSKLTCNKMKVNMQTKEGVAEGNARLTDEQGVITGEKIVYDFANKTGVILNADFRANPYFGKARKAEKVSDKEFIAKYGYFTTCNLAQPHYRFASKKINMFPGDKVVAKQNTLYLGAVPLIYIPGFNYSMKDPLMHVQLEPGSSKDWGPYMLSAWRYNLTENANGRIFLDYRNKLGWAEGFNLNYSNTATGRGDFKFYFTNEKNPDAGKLPDDSPSNFQRYFMRWRHKWDIDNQTNIVTEFYKISDKRWKYENVPVGNTDAHNILEDYFFREYEKDSQPLSYGLFHKSFDYSSLDLLFQMRTNHWFDQVEMKPQLTYNLPSLQLWDSRFYFEDSTQVGNYNKKKTSTSDPSAAIYSQDRDNVSVARLDTKNTFSYPTKISFIQFKPFVSSRQTFYDKGANDQDAIVRTIFYSGADLSTKFYRIFDVKTNFLNLKLNGLRHIITPTVGYLYTHVPTIPGTNIKQIDGVDSITRGNTATLGISNKLQTKRDGVSVDFVDFLITTDYVLDPKSGSMTGNGTTIANNAYLTPRAGENLKDNFSDIIYKLKILPYSWMRIEGDATFEHSDHTNINYNKFSLANYDLIFDLGKERTFTIGQRYERKGKNEVTWDLKWRLSPKWKFSIYNRHNFKKSAILEKGPQESQYTFTRDLHCWDLDISLNKKEGKGTSVFFTFRLKAFPENEFGFDQALSEKKSGTQ